MVQNFPTTYELYDMYIDFRTKYFDDLVPLAHEVTIEWCERMNGPAGKCSNRKRLIKMSTKYFTKFPQDTAGILIHEMIHLLVPNHGPQFYAWLKRIREKGGVVPRYSKEKADTKLKWEYVCQSSTCTYIYRKPRRVNTHSVPRKFTCPRCRSTVIEQKIVETI